MQTASKLQPRADDRILHLIFALLYEISCDQPVAIVFWVKMPCSDFVHRHEAAFRDFHIFLVGALQYRATVLTVCRFMLVWEGHSESQHTTWLSDGCFSHFIPQLCFSLSVCFSLLHPSGFSLSVCFSLLRPSRFSLCLSVSSSSLRFLSVSLFFIPQVSLFFIPQVSLCLFLSSSSLRFLSVCFSLLHPSGFSLSVCFFFIPQVSLCFSLLHPSGFSLFHPSGFFLSVCFSLLHPSGFSLSVCFSLLHPSGFSLSVCFFFIPQVSLCLSVSLFFIPQVSVCLSVSLFFIPQVSLCLFLSSSSLRFLSVCLFLSSSSFRFLSVCLFLSSSSLRFLSVCLFLSSSSFRFLSVCLFLSSSSFRFLSVSLFFIPQVSLCLSVSLLSIPLWITLSYWLLGKGQYVHPIYGKLTSGKRNVFWYISSVDVLTLTAQFAVRELWEVPANNIIILLLCFLEEVYSQTQSSVLGFLIGWFFHYFVLE